MSVINQVLDQLERRGAHAALKQNMVRVVPQVRRNTLSLALIASGALLLVALGLWLLWMQVRDVSQTQPSTTVAKAIVFAPVSAVAVPMAMSSPLAVPGAETPPVIPLPASQSEPAQAASRLSSELSSVTLPSRSPELRQKPEQSSSVSTGKIRASGEKPGQSLQMKDAVTQTAPVTASNTPMKQVSRVQQADAEFHRGVASMQQGRGIEAIASYEAALRLDATHDAARQGLVALLLEQQRRADAERILQERLESKPEHTGFAMVLARLEVERSALNEALATLERSLRYAEKNAEYRAFFAALLQRDNRHAEAAAQYQAALQLKPGNGTWLMGYGLSLQALKRNDEAKAAFQQALESKNLGPELRAFVQQRIKGL